MLSNKLYRRIIFVRIKWNMALMTFSKTSITNYTQIVHCERKVFDIYDYNYMILYNYGVL